MGDRLGLAANSLELSQIVTDRSSTVVYMEPLGGVMMRLEEEQDESYYWISYCYKLTKGVLMVFIVISVYKISTLLSCIICSIALNFRTAQAYLLGVLRLLQSQYHLQHPMCLVPPSQRR